MTSYYFTAIKHSQSSHGGLVVQHLLQKKCHCATVDQIPLGDDYLYEDAGTEIQEVPQRGVPTTSQRKEELKQYMKAALGGQQEL